MAASVSVTKVPVRVTYVWLGGQDTFHDIRSKDRTVLLSPEAIRRPEARDFSEWNFDGSSTGQAAGRDTEILVRPAAAFLFPPTASSGSDCALLSATATAPISHVALLCDCYFPDGRPTPCNTRAKAAAVFNTEAAAALAPWYGLEQEYVLMKNDRPLGWPDRGFPPPQGPYYCGNGADRSFGRELVDAHYTLCLSMGIRLSGTNAEVTPGQWEFQVGPCPAIEGGDHLVMARWLFLRLLESFSRRDGCLYAIDYSPKPIKGNWNGSGLHTNFSTAATRDVSKVINPAGGGEEMKGMQAILECVKRLEGTCKEDLACYGTDNSERLTGQHETSSLDKFTFGIGTRNTSVRIPNQVAKDGFGYFEDRRPGANADPYIITARVLASSCGLPMWEGL